MFGWCAVLSSKMPHKVLYNVRWNVATHPLVVEMDCVRWGGRWKKRGSLGFGGNGLFFHFKRGIQLLWPEIKWHSWLDLQVKSYLEYRTIGVIGPASTGKTFCAGVCVLFDYYCFPSTTTVLVCSTTREMLENRVWGEIKKYHKIARERLSWIPGHLIEGRQRIITDERTEGNEGRDFRNGLQGVPIKRGENYVGLGDFAGVKNKRVRVVFDEMHLLPRVAVDAISNLDKNPDLKAWGLGNPKDTTDALGVLMEPAAHLGGWDGGIDQTPKTKTWEIRRPQGVCIQLPGPDSPNLDGKLGIPLISQTDIDRDVAFYGKDSLWFTMMDLGQMPRGQGSRRVLTRQMCLKFGAMEEPNWETSQRTKIGFLDAAYRGVGGDRCVFGELQFGNETPPVNAAELDSAILSQSTNGRSKHMILALIETMLVPITSKVGDASDMPEDQIVNFVRAQCEARGIAPQNFFFDSGMRTSLVSAFARLWSAQVCPIDCGGSASQRKVSDDIDVVCKDYYSKFITEQWYSVRLIVEARQFRGMTEEVMNEFSMREWTMVGANRIEVETKEKVKLKNGRSPDLADAVAIGCEGARQRGFVIKRLASHRYVEADERWKTDLRNQARKLQESHQLNYAA